MVETKVLLKASLEAGKELLRSPVSRTRVEAADKRMPVMVPIRSLGENHRARLATHLLSLDLQDRY